jgi:small GTP-binding protein
MIRRKMADVVLKVLILGSENVGKSNFKRLADHYFQTDYKPVVGVNVLSKMVSVRVDGKTINAMISLWDISSKSRFEEIRKLFFKGGVGALFVFDLTKSSTWFEIIECYKEIVLKSQNIPFMVIGNLEHNAQSKIDIEDVKTWVKQHGGHFVLIDPKDSSLLEKTFINLITEIMNPR